MVKLPVTARGNKNILVITDMFTKWPEAYALPTKTAEAVADALFSFVCRHGLPKKIQTDQGAEFLNAVISRLMDRSEVMHATTSPYNPQCNGAAENVLQNMTRLKYHLLNLSMEDRPGFQLQYSNQMMLNSQRALTSIIRIRPGYAKDSEFAVGDEVMLFSPSLRTADALDPEVACQQFQPKWNGPSSTSW